MNKEVLRLRVLFITHQETMRALEARAEWVRRNTLKESGASEAEDQELAEALETDEELRAYRAVADELLEELTARVHELPLWQQLFSEAAESGCDEVMAAGLIGFIQSISRFESLEHFKKYLGLRPYKQSPDVYWWNPELRHLLYILINNFFSHPDSQWGQVLQAELCSVREKCASEGVSMREQRIRSQARRRTLSKFVEWVYEGWSRLGVAV